MIQLRPVFAVTLLSCTLVGMPVHAQSARSITVAGTLTDAGVECRAMQGDDGVIYTMRRVGALAEFKTGDRIKVTGTIAAASICQQGTTIDNPKIEKTN